MADYIDSCVFLAVVFGERDERCILFLDRVGYRQHPRGVISHYTMSELFVAVLTKREERMRMVAFGLAADLLTRLYERRRFTIEKLLRDERLFDAVKEQDYEVSDDDTFHLVAAVRAGCDRFITIDKRLLGSERLRGWLKKEHGLKLAEP